MPYAKRTLEKAISQVSKTFPAVLITGPRQVGKTTIFKECAKKRRKYVSLDGVAERTLAKEDPALFLERYSAPVLIDEIQYAPELLPYIKKVIDDGGQDGLFWLTGSQQFHLMKNVSESLAGRIGILHLQGFSIAERMNDPDREPYALRFSVKKDAKPLELMSVYEMIWRGAFPRLCMRKEVDWEIFYSSYLSTYIERDIRDLQSVNDEAQFFKFIRAAAARTGQLLNYADIAKDTGISIPTAKSWLSLLLTSGLVYLLEPYSNNLTKRLIKTPKLYFLDTGLVCYLSGWQTPRAAESGAQNGALFETFVVSEILKGFWHSGKTPRLFFYRDRDMKEVDLIIEKDGLLHPIEIKKKSAPDRNDIKNFSALSAHGAKVGQGAVICLAGTHYPITKDVEAVPVGCL